MENGQWTIRPLAATAAEDDDRTMTDRPRILLFTGDGKGKTTAALGLALRAAGHGAAAIILQFLKAPAEPGAAPAGESAAAHLLRDVVIAQVGLGFVPPEGDPRRPEHRDAARAGLRRAEQAIASGVYPGILLDEICLAVSLGLLEEAAVIAAVRKAAPGTCIVLTGRGAIPTDAHRGAPGLIDLADTVTEMRCVKHAYDSGTAAQRGVEF
jgi:cob(I)alamin adenosyltransferase